MSGIMYSAIIPIMLVGTIIEIVNNPAMNAPLLAVLPSLAENTLSIKSSATTSPRPNAIIADQFSKAPFLGSVNPDKSK